eukprot:191929-Chlamydomonas_euryale.AAC.1
MRVKGQASQRGVARVNSGGGERESVRATAALPESMRAFRDMWFMHAWWCDSRCNRGATVHEIPHACTHTHTCEDGHTNIHPSTFQRADPARAHAHMHACKHARHHVAVCASQGHMHTPT